MRTHTTVDKKFAVKVDEDCTLLDFLSRKLQGYSRNKIKSLMEHRLLSLSDGTLLQRHDTALKKGQVVEVHSARTRAGKVVDNPKLNIIYEDDFIIVVEKKEGLLSVRAPRQLEDSASHILNMYLRGRRGRNNHIFVVHRLDKETSGVMMFAKDRDTQLALRDNWRDMVKERSYIAVVAGVMEQGSGSIKSYLTEDIHQKMHSSEEDNGGQYAVTNYKVLQAGKRYSLLRLDLETGRKNQIRVHLESTGHPVAGDLKYSGGPCPLNRLCLHAQTLDFVHPVTRKRLRFEIPYPESFNRLVAERNPKPRCK